MRNMKDSGIEWIGEIPEDWEILKISNIIDFTRNEINKNEDKEVLSLSINGIKVKTNLSDGMNPEDYSNHQIAKIGDLVICLRDLDGQLLCGVSKFEGCLSKLYYVYKFKENANYYNYIFHCMDWCNYLDTYSYGMRHSYNNAQFSNLYTILPSKIEQELIANYLDNKVKEIDDIISKTQETIEEYKKYKQSVITEAVTKGLNLNVEMKDSGIEWIGEIPKYWDIIPLKYLVGLNENSLKENTDDNYEFDYIDIGSVTLEDGIKQYQRMKFSESPSRARRKVKYKDVIVSTVRTYLKAISTIPDKENIIVSTGFAVLTPYNINHKYLGYFTKSNYFTDVVSKYSTGISYPAINSSQIVNFKILVPSEGEQLSIAHFLDEKCNKIDNLIKQKQEIIIQLESYKKSLIYEYVTGKKEVAVAYGY